MIARDWLDAGILLMFTAPLVVSCVQLGLSLWRTKGALPDPAEDAKKWGVVLPLLVVAGGYGLFAYILAPTMYGFLYSLFFADTAGSITAWVQLSYVSFFYSLTVSVMQLMLLFWYLSYCKSHLRSLGLTKIKGRHFIDGALAYGIYFLIYLVILATIYNFFPQIDSGQQQQVGFENVAGLEIIFAFLSLVIIPPIVEEIIMRGFLYRALKKRLSYVASVIVTSVVFALAHLQLGSGDAPLWIAAIDTFILSIILIKVSDRARSLWPAIFLHMIKNGIAFVTLFILAK